MITGVGPIFSRRTNFFRKKWSEGQNIFSEIFGPRTIISGTNFPVTGALGLHKSKREKIGFGNNNNNNNYHLLSVSKDVWCPPTLHYSTR